MVTDMNRRDFLRLAGFAGLGLGFGGVTQAQDVKPRLSFVFILVDDLGWRDLGCFGSTFYETPNIDRLAASGMRFTNAYAACPVCSPTRASIMTGKYPARLGLTDYIAPNRANQPEAWTRPTAMLPAPYADRLPLSETTLAESLRASGYRTHFAGKWHLGPEGYWPEDQGFEWNKGGCEFGGPYTGKGYFSPYNNPRLTNGPVDEHLPERLARETCEFIEARQSEPFLAYLSFYSVHTPLMARPDLQAKYEAKVKLAPAAGPEFMDDLGRSVRQAQNHPIFAGMVEAMDQAVGKVLRRLDDLGLTDNTAIVFVTDNGGLSTSEGSPTSNVPLRAGKGWLYEGGIRAPMIIRWPGVTPPGSICGEPVITTDFYPTLLDMAGLPASPAQHMDGVSLTPLLRQSGALAPRDLFWHYPHYGNQGGFPGSVIQADGFKLIENLEDGSLQLYNLREDIGERNDLAAAMPELAASLRERLRAWRDSVGARYPVKRA